MHAPDRRAPLLYAEPVDGDAAQRHKAIVRRFLQDVYNRRGPAAATGTCGRGISWHGGSLGDVRGLPAYQQVLASLLLAFPDLEVDVLDLIAEEDRVVARLSICGTHSGQFMGLAPSFERVAGEATNIYRIEDGRIIEEWWQSDLLSAIQRVDTSPSGPRSSS